MDGHDVGDLLHAELGSHAGQEVFAEGGAGSEDVGVAFLGQFDDLGGDDGGEFVVVFGAVDLQDFADAVKLGGFGGGGAAVLGEDGDFDVAADQFGGGNDFGDAAAEFAVGLLADNKNLAHVI